jgi:3',5'-cyclic AMP phosphodiesterase CpdA
MKPSVALWLLSALHGASCIAFNRSLVRLVQFADLHLGEDAAKDSMTIALMRSVLSRERPDFIVFTGDQVSGYEVRSFEERALLWQRAVSVAAEFEIPFATLFGNHDDQLYHLDLSLWNGIARAVVLVELSVCAALWVYVRKRRRRVGLVLYLCLSLALVCATAPSKAVRRALVAQERRAYPTLSHTGMGPEDLRGLSNYRVVLETPGASVPLYFMDSGGGMLDSAISPDQLEWLRSFEPSEYALAFVHIAPIPFGAVFSDRCQGDAPREGAAACPGSEALLEALRSIGVRALFVGHDHGNSWCCDSDAMLLCYGRHSGFGGYDFDETLRGARVIEVNASAVTSVATRVSLWDSGG